jgi:hypothetical protein
LGGLALKKYMSIEGSLSVDSKRGCETTIDRDNELFWTEKFIFDAKSSFGCTRGGVNRQAHREHRTFARLARHGHVPAHHARELAGDGKAEPGAAEALSGVRRSGRCRYPRPQARPSRASCFGGSRIL